MSTTKAQRRAHRKAKKAMRRHARVFRAGGEHAFEYGRRQQLNLRAAGAVGGLLLVMLVVTALLGA